MFLRICNRDSAVATCDSYNFDKLTRRTKHRTKSTSSTTCCTTAVTDTTTTPPKLRRFSYAEITAATENFAPSALLGKGSHGAVYSALLNNGALLAAVKRSTTTTTQSQSQSQSQPPSNCCSTEKEFDILSKLHHPRFVNLLGYALDPATSPARVVLVVEHMPNGSLYDLLHNNNFKSSSSTSTTSSPPPSFPTRIRHALHVAKATLHLHTSTPPVIHRDIKSSNVLIDGSGRARLGDFGLAVRGTIPDLRATATPPAGTLGYLDPCYLRPGDLSTKSDVFSFGILLLEIITGRRAMDFDHSPPSVVDWAVPLIKAGREAEIYDGRVRRVKKDDDKAALRMLAVLAVRCVRSTAEKRPDMAEVVSVIHSAALRRIRSIQSLLLSVVRSTTTTTSTSTAGLDSADKDIDSSGDDDDDRRCLKADGTQVISTKRLLPVTTITGRGSNSNSTSTSTCTSIILSRSRRRKVSSVLPTTTNTGIGIKFEARRGGGEELVIIARSRSLGNPNNVQLLGLPEYIIQQRAQFAVRVAAAATTTVKLSKSRSTGSAFLLPPAGNVNLPQGGCGGQSKTVDDAVLPLLLLAGLPKNEEGQRQRKEEKNQNQNLKDSKTQSTI